MPSLRLVTDATAEPVTVDDLKLHLRLDTTYTTEDELLTGLIKIARKEAENRTRRALLPETWKLTLDDFEDEMVLNVSPLSTASTDVTITYLDETSGDSTTLASTYYRVDVDSEPGRVRLGYESSWPTPYDVKGAVSIQFKAGFPINTAATPATDTCPEPIEQWIKMRAAGLYEMRESHTERPVQEQARSFLDGLLDPYVIVEMGP